MRRRAKHSTLFKGRDKRNWPIASPTAGWVGVALRGSALLEGRRLHAGRRTVEGRGGF